MVLEGVKERAIEYLKEKGLATEDVGRVIGIFFFAKYITFLSMIPVCHKFQPIRRLMKPIIDTQPGREYFTARRNKFQQSRIASAIAARTKGYRDWLKLRQPVLDEKKLRLLNIQKQAKQFVLQKRLEQEHKIREREEAAASGSSSWGNRIYKWTEKMAEKVSKNEKWKTVAESFSVPPKDFAYAVGEGLVMYKITAPIWMTAELFIIVKYLQWRRQRIEEHDSKLS